MKCGGLLCGFVGLRVGLLWQLSGGAPRPRARTCAIRGEGRGSSATERLQSARLRLHFFEFFSSEVLARHKTGTSRTSCGGLPFMLTCWVLCRTASLQLSSEVAGVGIDGAVFGPRDQGFLELLSVWCWNALDKAQACQAEATAAKDEVPCALDSP